MISRTAYFKVAQLEFKIMHVAISTIFKISMKQSVSSGAATLIEK